MRVPFTASRTVCRNSSSHLGVNVIGRGRRAAVRVHARDVSRRHAQIVVTSDGAIIEDLGSTNGTVIAGERLSAPRRLRDGDEVRLGDVILTFHASWSTASTMMTPVTDA